VVDLYEKVYEDNRILLEVTKPSEQSFKALISPTCIGGSILLFSEPVGRQEWDNISFLRRHNLIPDKNVQERLWKLPEKLSEEAKGELRGWRGLMLPRGAGESARFIKWCLKAKVLELKVALKGKSFLTHL